MAEYVSETITESDLLQRCYERGVKANTRRNYLGTFKSLGLLDRPITVVDCQIALESVKNMNTRRRHAIALKAMLTLDTSSIRIGDHVSRQYYLPTQDEYDFYRALFPFPERLDLMYYAGLRVSEACYEPELTGNVLNVRFQVSQRGTIEPAKTTGPVVIPTWLIPKLVSMPKWEGTSNRLSKAVYNHSKRTGIPIVAHGLRAAYATRLVRAGADPEMLRRQMRHKSASMSLTIYYQVKQSDMLPLIDSL